MNFMIRHDRRTVFYGLFTLAAIIAFCAGLALMFAHEQQICMAVPILTESRYSSLTESSRLMAGKDIADALEQLQQDGAPAAVDTVSRTAYISQQVDADTLVSELEGKLDTKEESYSLYFAPDHAFSNMAEAIAQNHVFTLLVTHDGRRMTMSVIFTTLPVMNMEQQEEYNSGDSDMRRVIEYGKIYLWNPYDIAEGRYSVKDSYAEWHIRGHSTTLAPKKSYKISLKKKSGENHNVALLDMPKDDDWILNSLWQDDTNMREKLAMDLWSEMRETNDQDDPMAQGKYVEVVMNGSYQGLYLLQTRVDRKSLSLDKEEDYLIKGHNSRYAADLAWDFGQDVFTVKYAPDGQTGAVRAFLPYYATYACGTWKLDTSILNLHSLTDAALLVQYGNMQDTIQPMNMYFIERPRPGGGYITSFVPWDTDMSFGIRWGDGFEYHPETADDGTNDERCEVTRIRDNGVTEEDEMLYARWVQLRGTVLSTENATALLDGYEEDLSGSGAAQREQALWGTRHAGEDTYEALKEYIARRGAWLDDWYDSAKESK